MVFANNRSLPIYPWSAFQICEPLFLTRSLSDTKICRRSARRATGPLWYPTGSPYRRKNAGPILSRCGAFVIAVKGAWVECPVAWGGLHHLEITMNSWVACSHFMNFATSKPPNLYPSAVTINNQHDQHPIPTSIPSDVKQLIPGRPPAIATARSLGWCPGSGAIGKWWMIHGMIHGMIHWHILQQSMLHF